MGSIGFFHFLKIGFRKKIVVWILIAFIDYKMAQVFTLTHTQQPFKNPKGVHRAA